MDETCKILHNIITKSQYGLTFTELKQNLSETGRKLTDSSISTHLKHLLLHNRILHSNKQYLPQPDIYLQYSPPIIHKKIDIQFTFKENKKDYQIFKYKKIRRIENLSPTPLSRYRLRSLHNIPQEWNNLKITINDSKPKLINEGKANPYYYSTYVEIFPPLLKNKQTEIVFETELQVTKEYSHNHILRYPLQEINFSLQVKNSSSTDLEVYKIKDLNFDWFFLQPEKIIPTKNKITFNATFDIQDYEPNHFIQFHWLDKKSTDQHKPQAWSSS